MNSGARATHRTPPSRTRRSPFRGIAGAVAVLLGATPAILSHTPITTRYGFADDVLPVLEKHCLRCHSEGGPTPMSLGTYREARPWAESIKEQVLERGMPPLFVEHGSARVENGSPLTGRELDILVDWASGGAPEGSRTESKERGAGAESTPRRADDPAEGGADPDAEWRVHEWDGFVSPADQDRTELRASHRVRIDEIVYVTGWTLESDPPWLRGAVLWIEDTPAGGAEARTVESDTFLGSWVAGDGPFLFPPGAAFELRPGAKIRVDARYERTWLLRSRKLEPRTRLRMRFAPREAARRAISVPVPLEEQAAARFGAGAAMLAFFPAAPGRLLVERAPASRVLLDLYRVSEEWPVMYRFPAPESGLPVWRPEGPPNGAAIGGYALYVTD